ncbi:single-strand binding protein (plasmid) [Clostridium botulinum Af84]|uniref:single-stranded DNA-binding protein n=1 Tax=Clostridium botulinum TaxID=1491 RepID=UPI00035BA01B|nr:single-stranded DNA-binding protein [Clostridium botulinum]APR02584.1 single-stranded DNA-binding family protein [Clostridium botulinum]AUN19754.1 single-stranded DNA-binding protein [Clostridium botulinum]EPS54308.1 single-strand binding protein [Clostridium botulinum Af84]NFM82246.1 single-stranded DNA-binding protein [Clostridium botulinum]NFP09937.1 single-stranded DNA-binding protein [Clostridium botulinum]
MNKVVLIGRLTKDPELKFTPGNGTAVANFTLAVDRRFSKDGQREADFIPIVVWGKQAESTANYMSKGKLMGVSGRIQTRSYEAKDGTKRYITEVIAEEVKFLEWGDKATTDSSYNNRSESSYQSGQNFENGNSFDDDIIPVDDGDIPF